MTIEYFRINDPSDLEVVNPKECEKYPGYYHIPAIDNYVINREGSIIKLEDGFTPKILINSTGYHVISYKINQKQFKPFVHRWLAMTFIGRPSRHKDKVFSQLFVNHINGIKTDNRLENLEWCTDDENNRHALFSGLTTKNIKVVAKHILTGKELCFISTLKCAKYFKIIQSTLSLHLKSAEVGTVTKDWYVFKSNDGTAWPELTEEQTCENSWDFVNVWHAYNEKLNKVVLAYSLRELCEALNITMGTYYDHIKRTDHNTALNGWLISMSRRNIAKDEMLKIPLRNYRNKQKIKVTNILTQQINVYESMNAFAKEIEISIGSISRAIEMQNGKYKHYYIEKID